MTDFLAATPYMTGLTESVKVEKTAESTTVAHTQYKNRRSLGGRRLSTPSLNLLMLLVIAEEEESHFVIGSSEPISSSDIAMERIDFHSSFTYPFLLLRSSFFLTNRISIS